MLRIKPDKDTVKQSLTLSASLLKAYKPYSAVLPVIAATLRKHKKFVLTTHISSDADGLGSEIGLYALLRQFRKDVIIVNEEPPAGYLQYMTGDQKIFWPGKDNRQDLTDLFTGRFVLLLDTSELKRSPTAQSAITRLNLQWASIDHHILPINKNYFVDASYAATSEMIWDLYQYLKIRISPAAAIAMYSGIVADSGNFRYGKTTLRTHLAGGHLIGLGLHSDMIYRLLYESQPVDRIVYLRRILRKTRIDRKNGIIYAEVLPSAHTGLDLGDSPSEGIVNQLLAHTGIRAAALITRIKSGGLKASLRSVGDTDVAAVARQFGGGGHKNAAGLKITGSYRAARRALIKALTEVNPS